MEISGLRFLADESCDFAVVRALRGAGHDVHAVSEEMSRSVDEAVIAQAAADQRILLTEDKDFGWLVFVTQAEAAGVILIRYPGNARQDLVRAILRLVEEQGALLHTAFVVVQPGHIRISPRQSPDTT
jgi:predicted nuclease of predicted toxin-antitoxin system